MVVYALAIRAGLRVSSFFFFFYCLFVRPCGLGDRAIFIFMCHRANEF
jgi:hypothetical protein